MNNVSEVLGEEKGLEFCPCHPLQIQIQLGHFPQVFGFSLEQEGSTLDLANILNSHVVKDDFKAFDPLFNKKISMVHLSKPFSDIWSSMLPWCWSDSCLQLH